VLALNNLINEFSEQSKESITLPPLGNIDTGSNKHCTSSNTSAHQFFINSPMCSDPMIGAKSSNISSVPPVISPPTKILVNTPGVTSITPTTTKTTVSPQLLKSTTTTTSPAIQTIKIEPQTSPLSPIIKPAIGKPKVPQQQQQHQQQIIITQQTPTSNQQTRGNGQQTILLQSVLPNGTKMANIRSNDKKQTTNVPTTTVVQQIPQVLTLF